MALIIKCAGCRKRLWDALPCACGSTVRRFIVDYWPNGRHGKRDRIPLPDSIQDVKIADAIEKSIRTAARDPEEPQINPAGATVAELFPDYLTWYELNREPSSKKDVESVWNNHLKPIFGAVNAVSINRNHFTAYQQARKATTVSNRTINKELDYFRGFLRWCRVEKQMAMTRIEAGKLPCHRPLPIVLSPAEVLAVIDAAEPVYQALFICYYSMGLRKSEALNLTWGDIDTANKQIRVRQKGGSFKILPASDWLMDALKRIKPGKAKASDYVFLSKRTDLPLQNLRRAIERACKKAKVTKYVHPHLFRHSIAVHFMADGINQRMIQRFMGHADSKATEFYTNVSAAHLRGLSDRFDTVSTAHVSDVKSK
jgi:site-specific recombinase XerD